MLPFSATGVREKNKKEGKERISRKWGKKAARKGDGKSKQKTKGKGVKKMGNGKEGAGKWKKLLHFRLRMYVARQDSG